MLVQQPDGAFALTDIGSVNQHTQHKAIRVNNQLSLATLDIFFPRRNPDRLQLRWS
jgi:hypothetical protein